MFNLKKITAAFSGPASAETIQRELLDSTDAIIAEARAIVEKGLPELSDKARKLERLGFTATKEVVDHRLAASMKAEKQAVVSLHEKYALEYPGLKFIDEKTMDAVCKKHGLLIGSVGRYKGDVPDWALDRIDKCGVNLLEYRVYWDALAFHHGAVREASRLCIAAPIADMHIKSNERIVGNKIVALDPIVSIRVDGGYCVIVVWGEEGKDTRVFNAQVN